MEDLPAQQSCGQAIRRLKRGDMGGLECLIARYQEKALRAAFLITHDEPMAEDVVQDVFVRFYERANFFDETRPFEPYFMRSIVNSALNCLEREKNRLFVSDADGSYRKLLTDGDSYVVTVPAWSPDGNWVIASVPDPNANSQPNAVLALIHVEICQIVPVPNLSGYVTSWLP